jgi:hypothetical protein
MVSVVAWLAIFLVSDLTGIIWRIGLRSPAPAWTLAARVVALMVLLGLTFSISSLRPLRAFIMVLIATATGFLLKDLLYQHRTIAAWIEEAPWRDAVIVSSTLKVIPVLAMAVTLIGLTRREVFLIVGNLNAPSRIPFTGTTVRWSVLGPSVILVFVAALGLYLLLVMRPDFSMLRRTAALLPLILSFSALNAFNEEFIFRAGVLPRLVPVVGGEQAVWMTSLRFGLGHWFGSPRGLMGVAMATILGLFGAKSMLETGGFVWAWIVHGLLDVVIFSFLIMSAAR